MDDHRVRPSTRQFLLLFYRSAGDAPVDDEECARRDREFDDWVRSVETRGELVWAGRLLQEAETRLGPRGEALESEGRAADLTRVCVIRARDRPGAIETARRAPQVLRGAGAVVRELEAR